MHGSDEPAAIAATLSGDDVPVVPRVALERGVSVGRYVLLDELGRGGMGIVYAAFDPELDRKVAIKLLRVRDEDATQARARLLREAQAMARLDHPNVVAVHDVGTFDDHVFVAMEFVDGVTLRAWARAQPRGWREVVEVMTLAGRGLAAAHGVGLVHGDFKPDNVMIGGGRSGSGPRIRVMDFGLARREGEQTGADEHARSALLVIGTPGYVAPERLAGQPSDARADQFAFGVSLWELLYGVPAFGGTTPLEIASNVVQGQLASPPRSADVPGWLRALVLRALSAKPQDRFATLDELLAALTRDPSRRRRRAALLLGSAAIVVAGLSAQRIQRAHALASCDVAGDEIRGVWNDARRADMHVAFDASGAGNAVTTWAKVAPLLDAYVDEWSIARTRVCAAIEGDGTMNGERA
ncbi:MAG TPA: serine/threonine-protein kinase, partial [Nannocystaceae bacterium]|nr:serine/threonine-protein kinase [Nannocystaceae bacterium]